jgi:hypothetical protein
VIRCDAIRARAGTSFISTPPPPPRPPPPQGLNPKQLQIDITGFLEKQAPVFIEELWTLLVEAQKNKHGIPQAFLEQKKKQLQSASVQPAVVPPKEIKYLGATTMAPLMPIPSSGPAPDIGASVEQAKAKAAAAAAAAASQPTLVEAPP